MEILSVIANLFLNGQDGCSSFCTSACMDDQMWSLIFAKAVRCSSSRVTALVMQSAMPMHDYCIDRDVYASYFFVSFWLCLDSQFVINSCGPGMYSILMLYWCIHSSIVWSLYDRLATFWSIAISGWWSVITLTSWATVVVIFKPCAVPRTSLSVLL